MNRELEFLEEKYGHNSWEHYPPSKQQVAQWLQEFTENQFAIHSVVKSLPTSKEMTDVVSDISIQAKRSNDKLDVASYGIGFIDGYRWTVENTNK